VPAVKESTFFGARSYSGLASCLFPQCKNWGSSCKGSGKSTWFSCPSSYIGETDKPEPAELRRVVLLTSLPSLTMLWKRTMSSTGTVHKWSPGRHRDKPDGSNRHFGLGRPPTCMNWDTGSYQLSHTWDQVISGSLAPHIVNSQQDVNQMPNRHQNVVIR